MTIQEQIEQLKQDIKNTNALLNAQLAALEEQLKVAQPSKVHVPEIGEVYFTISWGRTDAFEAHWDNTIFDRNALKMGNAFQTKEECEWEIQHRIITTEFKNFVTDNDPNPITEEDWEVNDRPKFYIRYDCVDEEFGIDIICSCKIANQVYASNKEVLEKAIEHIGEERLKKYYFGVKD